MPDKRHVGKHSMYEQVVLTLHCRYPFLEFYPSEFAHKPEHKGPYEQELFCLYK
jgi:hypothetical protein